MRTNFKILIIGLIGFLFLSFSKISLAKDIKNIQENEREESIFIENIDKKRVLQKLDSKHSIIEQDSVLPILNPNSEKIKIVKKIRVVITAYSSSEDETDDTPFISASGKRVRDGIIATNILPFGTKVRIPLIFGKKIFIVEDRMSKEKKYQIDVWHNSKEAALNFGIKRAEIEIIKEI